MENKPLPGNPGAPGDIQRPIYNEYSTTLPYEQLPGDGLKSFELLCFRILMAEKKNPHFFARKGQDDYGVDILGREDNGHTTVYQCKNLKGGKDKLYKSDFKKAFDKFYNDWVKEQKLPVPNAYVYCTSARIAADNDSHSNFLTASEDFKKQFQEECGQPLQVNFWDCTDLDEKLKKYPDIVSELFGSEAAARHCGFYGWDSDLFINVQEDGERDRFLQEYFKKKQRIYIPQAKREQLTEIIKEHRKVLICGFPGTGKTSLALALAEGFSIGTSSSVIPPSVYYVNFKRAINWDSLNKGIRQRGFLPSVFIFDDCQEKMDLAIELNYILEHIIGEKQQIFCIFLLRTTLTREERRDEDSVLRELFDPGAIKDYAIDDKLFQEIAVSLKPGLRGIDYNALFHLSGGDLFILDFILEKMKTAGDIVACKGEKGRQELYQKVIETYFKGGRQSLGNILGLLVLAQFDIGIHPGYYDRVKRSILQESMKKILDGLVVTAGTPARCYFLHSSLAELLCRAAMQEQGGSYIETVTRSTLGYFKYLVEAGVDYQEFNRFLINLIFAKLKIGGEANEENNICVGFLKEQGVISAVKVRFDQVFPNIIAGVLRLLEGQEVFFDYLAVLKEKIESGQYTDTVIFFGYYGTGLFFRFLKEGHPELFNRLKKTFDGEKLKILFEKENLQGLVRLVNIFFDEEDEERLDKVLEPLGEKDIEQIVERTIREGRSIGTLHLGLRELQKKGLLEQWERKVSPAYYRKLIVANGTIFELIKFLEHSTIHRAGELIDALSEDVLQDLIAKTIASGRSIGTLGLGLRELQEKGLLEQWERKVSPAHYLKLIAANGTIFELIKFLEHSTAHRAGELIDALSEDVLQDLIAKTIAAGRSIGTLDLGLRELHEKGLLEQWERKVSPAHYLKLIAANGTFVELINILQRSTEPMARKLMQCISRKRTDGIIKNTIARKPSLTSLQWGIKHLLHLTGSDSRLFDEKIGLDNLFQLIISTGNPAILIQVMDNLPGSIQQILIQASRSLPAEKMAAFILQGNIYDFCAAAAHYPQLIVSPGETGPDLNQLAPIITQLIKSSDFFSLGRCISSLEEITHPEFKALVLEQVARRLDLLPLEKVHFTSNTEKVNYLALLNRLEKLDAEVLHRVVPTINRKSYVKEKYFFSSLRHLFQVLAAHETDISSSLRQEMLDLANSDMIAGILDKQDLLPIFLYLWNTYALFITEQDKKDKRQFNHWLNPAIKETIFKKIEKNKNLRSVKPEYENLLMLVGLLDYLNLRPTNFRATFTSSFQLDISRRYLGNIMEKCTFVTGCFFLKGVEFFLGRPVYTEYWELLKVKQGDYKVQTMALRELMDLH